MPSWGWIVVGAVLLGAETIVDAQFYLVFFGAAALVTGGLALMFGPLPAGVDWALFGALSVAGTAAFRKRVYQRTRQVDGEVSQGTVGELAIARESIAAGGRGRVELRGTMWDGRNTGVQPIAAGERARVVATNGLVLDVQRES